MDRLGDGPIARATARAVWQARRGLRAASAHLGWAGWIALALVAGSVALSLVERQLSRDAEALRAKLAARLPPSVTGAVLAPAAVGASEGRARLRAFAAQLLPHDDIPAVLQDVLRLAQAEGLVTQRGDYRPQVDGGGGFMRYRMNLPVRGPAPAIYRFTQAALHDQPNLALESIQFKRDRIGVTEIEARIQWIVYATLPTTSGRDLGDAAPATAPKESR